MNSCPKLPACGAIKTQANPQALAKLIDLSFNQYRFWNLLIYEGYCCFCKLWLSWTPSPVRPTEEHRGATRRPPFRFRARLAHVTAPAANQRKASSLRALIQSVDAPHPLIADLTATVARRTLGNASSYFKLPTFFRQTTTIKTRQSSFRTQNTTKHSQLDTVTETQFSHGEKVKLQFLTTAICGVQTRFQYL